MDNADVADALKECASLLELLGENPFKARAHERAARSVEGASEPVRDLVDEGRLEELEGVGSSINQKIQELVLTGRMAYLEDLRERISPGLVEMLRLPGFGPKKIRALHDALGIETIKDLEKAAREGDVAEVKGFGKKSQENLLEGIEFLAEARGRTLLSEALPTAEDLVAALDDWKEVLRCELAGSARRRKATVGDLDIVCAVEGDADVQAVMDRFCDMDRVVKVKSHGDTKSSVVVEGGLSVDLRVVEPAAFPYTLHHFTGSKEHNVRLRGMAKDRGWKVNEYGIWDGDDRLPAEDEADIYDHFGMKWIPPELREDRGEFDAAADDDLPDLIEHDDIRGVFHNHTTESDGSASLEEMVRRAKELGYDYIGISDHSRSASYAGGLSVDELRAQGEAIAGIGDKVKGIEVLHGSECDILPDGSMDYPDDVLEDLDFVVASVHSSFRMDKDEQTARCVKALENKHVSMLGHPTGRLILGRRGFDVEVRDLIEAAKANGKALELNANPHRLDLDESDARAARDAGVPISINPDAHSERGLEDVRWGVYEARRAWLTADDVLNTRTAGKVRKALADMRS